MFILYYKGHLQRRRNWPSWRDGKRLDWILSASSLTQSNENNEDRNPPMDLWSTVWVFLSKRFCCQLKYCKYLYYWSSFAWNTLPRDPKLCNNSTASGSNADVLSRLRPYLMIVKGQVIWNYFIWHQKCWFSRESSGFELFGPLHQNQSGASTWISDVSLHS